MGDGHVSAMMAGPTRAPRRSLSKEDLPFTPTVKNGRDLGFNRGQVGAQRLATCLASRSTAADEGSRRAGTKRAATWSLEVVCLLPWLPARRSYRGVGRVQLVVFVFLLAKFEVDQVKWCNSII
jgi:hypothetical protein